MVRIPAQDILIPGFTVPVYSDNDPMMEITSHWIHYDGIITDWQIVDDLGHNDGVMEMSMRAQFFEGWRLDGMYGGRIPFDDFVSPVLAVVFESKAERFASIIEEWWIDLIDCKVRKNLVEVRQ